MTNSIEEKLEEFEEEINPPTCMECNKKMKPAYDSLAKKITGYLWHCECYPNRIISIG